MPAEKDRLKAAKKRYEKLKKERKAKQDTAEDVSSDAVGDSRESTAEAAATDKIPAETEPAESASGSVEIEEGTEASEQSEQAEAPGLTSHKVEQPSPDLEIASSPIDAPTEETAVHDTRVDDEDARHRPAEQPVPVPKTDDADGDTEAIADLREENDMLREKVHKLTLKISVLEAEVASLRAPTAELSLSPPRARSRGRNRAASSAFVEADLFSESSRIPTREKNMAEWRDWQLDLREWRTIGIGAKISI